ncbi:DUF427 domain-containing protein [Croceitalea sp. MTPC9]|uniref:DUF427 domain-containing protein n=1 Tax=unclassified Croceitalea TaxID=2632280 RepID=UPI002B37349C|nr:DUF427 domain-containing protein [Croceitalea sp. MTPC6]GMN16455.1 DUF427 domain-containing protein [Croceitalea sp. MTPC9]
MKFSDGKNKLPDWLKKARMSWEYNGKGRPPFAKEPKKGQISVWDFPRPPAIEKVKKEISVYQEKNCLAKTRNGYAIMETAHPPSYYIPPTDINQNFLIRIPNKKSLCEWKGSAIYWALKTDPEQAIAWSYPDPFSEFEAIKDHLAFYPQQLNCFIKQEKVTPQPGKSYAGWITTNLVGPFKGEPGTGHW